MWPPGLKTQECEGSVYFQLSLWIWLHMSISSILVIERYRKCSAISSIQRFSKDDEFWTKVRKDAESRAADGGWRLKDWLLQDKTRSFWITGSIGKVNQSDLQDEINWTTLNHLTVWSIFLFRHAFGMQVQVQEKEDEKVPSRSLSVIFLDLKIHEGELSEVDSWFCELPLIFRCNQHKKQWIIRFLWSRQWQHSHKQAH